MIWLTDWAGFAFYYLTFHVLFYVNSEKLPHTKRKLPGHLNVHSGHGPVTTLAEELQSNPFLGYIRKERGIDGAPGLRWAPGT